MRELISAQLNLDYMLLRNFLPAEFSAKLSSFEVLDLKNSLIGYWKHAIWNLAPMLRYLRIIICIISVAIFEGKKLFNELRLRREGGVRGQKNKFGLYQSPTCHRVTTIYRIAKSSFMTKIWRVKVRGYYSVPYKI